MYKNFQEACNEDFDFLIYIESISASNILDFILDFFAISSVYFQLILAISDIVLFIDLADFREF